MWRINRERCGLIYGPAAAILQIAHPRVAQGVHDHSNFRTDILGRLGRTLRLTNQIAFGTVSEAEALRARLAVMHRKVCGSVAAGIEGPRLYSAFEPDLLFWVLATLIHAAISGHEFIYRHLSLERKEAFYRDMCQFGTYFGVDESRSPKGWRAFESYYAGMVEGDVLGSHPICSELARAVVYPRDSAGTYLLGWSVNFLAIETLPPKLRERLGLRSTIWTRFRMRVTRRILPKVFPRFPKRLRFYPEYLRACQDSLDKGAE
ncbi:MAG TPA: oxygenase MpaB family protein [Terrimicrobiaceae bacterium]